MSWHPVGKSEHHLPACQPVRQVVTPKPHQLGGLSVKRALPTRYCRSIGPFVFLDQMGPSHFTAGNGVHIGQHPHIGLGTVTYLFAGELLHSDSLGTVQPIQPGALNWMIAGQGIVHAETSSAAVRLSGQQIYGMQSWLALPLEHESMSPAFQHIPAADLPEIELPGGRLRLLAGQWRQQRSPARMLSTTIYAELQLSANAELRLPQDYQELGIYLLSGRVRIDADDFSAGQLLVLDATRACTILAREDCHFMLLGGDALDARRHMWWNFVASDPARIEQAKLDWQAGRFALADPDIECIPLPD